jgi:hypothetical protein
MNLPTLVLAAGCCFVSGMLVEAVVWGRAAQRRINQLRRALWVAQHDCDRWRRAALLGSHHPAGAEMRRRARLRAVDN